MVYRKRSVPRQLARRSLRARSRAENGYFIRRSSARDHFATASRWAMEQKVHSPGRLGQRCPISRQKRVSRPGDHGARCHRSIPAGRAADGTSRSEFCCGGRGDHLVARQIPSADSPGEPHRQFAGTYQPWFRRLPIITGCGRESHRHAFPGASMFFGGIVGLLSQVRSCGFGRPMDGAHRWPPPQFFRATRAAGVGSHRRVAGGGMGLGDLVGVMTVGMRTAAMSPRAPMAASTSRASP